MNYKEYIQSKNNIKLKKFIETLSLSNKTADFFVNWKKVIKNTNQFELELNTLNYLVGKQNILEETRNLFNKQPELIRAVPSLIASREKEIIMLDLNKFNMEYRKLNFNNIDKEKIDLYVDFCYKIGLLEFISNGTKKSLVDYVYGVEAGLDSNARKNRSGITMETIVEKYIINLIDTEKLKLEYITQATPKMIKKQWGITVPVDRSQRKYDLVIFNKLNQKLYIIETNYYNGGESKLKSVCGEFVSLSNLLANNDKLEFIWITDGQGWKTANIPMMEAMGKIKNIFNLDMIFEKKYLKELVLN